MNDVERELVSGGFCWERAVPEPPSWEGVKSPNRKRSLAAKLRAYLRVPPARREYDREYRRRQREKWLLSGLVKPKDEAEREWLAEQQRGAA